VLLDFSTPAGTMHWLEFCLVQQLPIVICTTGHDDEQLAAIRAAASEIAVLKAANTSLGVTLMLQLVEQAARALADADIEIVEAHHRFKTDAPSGTANALLESVAAGLQSPQPPTVVYGRRAERKRGEIGMHSLRIGDATGEHEVHFGSIGETLTIRHRAHSRETFARGALQAVRWMAGRPAGWYTMRDVLIGER
jgi:4-hydroxy-tetrahydrodipicolinate reductase